MNILKILLIITTCIMALYSCVNSDSKKQDNSIITIKSTEDNEHLFIGTLFNDTVSLIQYMGDLNEVSITEIYINNELTYKANDIRNKIHRNDAKIIEIKNMNIGYILLTFNDSPYVDKWLVLHFKSGALVDIKSIIKDVFEDIDKDGYYEIGGREIADAPCLNCDSVYYSPYLIYKLDGTIRFDSTLSISKTVNKYGVFLGFTSNDTIVSEIFAK